MQRSGRSPAGLKSPLRRYPRVSVPDVSVQDGLRSSRVINTATTPGSSRGPGRAQDVLATKCDFVQPSRNGRRPVGLRAMSRWASFDCYGTLIDWNAGIRGELARVFGEDTADERLTATTSSSRARETGEHHRKLPRGDDRGDAPARRVRRRRLPNAPDRSPTWQPFPEWASRSSFAAPRPGSSRS